MIIHCCSSDPKKILFCNSWVDPVSDLQISLNAQSGEIGTLTKFHDGFVHFRQYVFEVFIEVCRALVEKVRSSISFDLDLALDLSVSLYGFLDRTWFFFCDINVFHTTGFCKCYTSPSRSLHVHRSYVYMSIGLRAHGPSLVMWSCKVNYGAKRWHAENSQLFYVSAIEDRTFAFVIDKARATQNSWPICKWINTYNGQGTNENSGTYNKEFISEEFTNHKTYWSKLNTWGIVMYLTILCE